MRSTMSSLINNCIITRKERVFKNIVIIGGRDAWLPWYKFGGQRTTFRHWFSPSTCIWVLDIELRSSGFSASTFTHWDISKAPPCSLFKMSPIWRPVVVPELSQREKSVFWFLYQKTWWLIAALTTMGWHHQKQLQLSRILYPSSRYWSQ